MKPSDIVNNLSEMAIEYASIDVCNPKRIEALAQAANLIQSLQPRPIEEAPRDGTIILAYSQDLLGRGLPSFWSVCFWHKYAGFYTDEIREPTHFIPLSAIQALMGSVEC